MLWAHLAGTNPAMSTPPRSPAGIFDRPYLLLVLTQLLWAGNIVLGRVAAGEIPPLMLAFLRWSIAAAIILPIAWPRIRRDWPVIKANAPLLLLLSATGIAAYNTLAYWGLNYTTALNILLLQSIGPLIVALWSFALFRERLTNGQLFGILTSLFGVVTIICHGDFTHLASLTFNVGDLMNLVALSIYGVYTVMLRKRPKMDHVGFLAITVAGGALMLAPIAALEFASGARMDVNPGTLSIVFYVGIFPSLVAYTMFVRAVDLVGANRASPFFHLIPVFGAILAIVFLGEDFQLFHAIGFALVISGVVIATLKAKRPLADQPV